jgi:parvulin-like peptidyl-prolyl isomerase
MASLFRQPLLHFLIIGVLIFVAYSVTDQPQPEMQSLDKVIEVDRTALLNFMQYRAQAFRPDLFNEQLDTMGEDELDQLVTAYVREEVLHREAVAMGMDQGDYIIRQRLVQKVEFLLENMVNQALEPDDDTIAAWYAERQEDYRIDAVYTFTHIFFDGDERGRDAAEQAARALLDSGRLQNVAFNDAAQFGDRYPFLQNYVERTRDFVVNNFTAEFTDALDTLTPANERWYGPFESRYGWHLVLLRERSDPYVPALADIRDRVTDDWRYETVLVNRRQAEAQVISGYTVNVELDGNE